jgi:RNase adapter protein RapZ
MNATVSAIEVVIITGMSGSGKSVAIHALEDEGYYCVDNLPPELVLSFVTLERTQGTARVAVAVDVRSADSLHLLPDQIKKLRGEGLKVHSLFLDSSTDTLVRRFSETRRRHPLSKPDPFNQQRALAKAIDLERELLIDLREVSHVIDTSMMRAANLQTLIKDFLGSKGGQLTLSFQSFAFKKGVPLDADYVFDVRMLPNPYYEPDLRELTGRDLPVAQYLAKQPAVEQFTAHIEGFLRRWLPDLARDHRSYVSVAIGCTGGQHRSVFIVEQLHARFARDHNATKRHRELESSGFSATDTGAWSAKRI